MFTIGELAPWQDLGFGLLLMILALVAAELLARYATADAARRRANSRGPLGGTSDHAVVADEFR